MNNARNGFNVKTIGTKKTKRWNFSKWAGRLIITILVGIVLFFSALILTGCWWLVWGIVTRLHDWAKH